MFSNHLRGKKLFLKVLALCLILTAGISIGYLTNHVFSENGKFEAFTKTVFESEVSSSTLTLHYSLAHPERQHIPRPEPSLGRLSSDCETAAALCREYEEKLKSFRYGRLSRENQLTLDLLLLCFHTRQEMSGQPLLDEVLSPSLGIQAQLPVLLAEYAFYEKQDITDYLKLLSDVKPYFQSILTFEQEKSAAGLFMSDTTLDRILSQCRDFIKDPDDNYMLDIFAEKIEKFGGFSRKEQDSLNAAHKKIIAEQVIPAYQELIRGLETLRGTGKSSRGLAAFPGGRTYYEYLLKSQAGTYDSVPEIEKRLSAQLMKDTKEISLMLREQPSLLTKIASSEDFPLQKPEEILTSLQEKIQDDFPVLVTPEYEIRYVHPSMEEYLSPAFYLTPPLDTGTPNVIYINRSGQSSGLDLFTTLAHEGFPGHLYQTIYFARQKPGRIRSLFSSGGYVEGWATYVESCACQYAADFLDDAAASDVTKLSWLNRSTNLCICALLDIGIHYRGWNRERAAQFLNAFGIRNESVTGDIYQYIVETPANYLKYCWGYLNFLDLRTSQEEKLGEDFNLKEFHEKILKIGPVPFPILEKYINMDWD